MRDTFFEKTHCDRCRKPLNGMRIMSMFNEDCLCMECKDAERNHSDYKTAVETDHAEIRKGNFNFKGIGYPGKQLKYTQFMCKTLCSNGIDIYPIQS